MKLSGEKTQGLLRGALAVWLGMVVEPSQAAPSQAVTSQRISLPSGPGSIEGLGESFEPQLNTGTFVFKIPLKLTKLRGAVAPEGGLTYNSGGGNGPVGLGWSMATSYLQRQTDKGLPAYTEADTIVESSGEELVKLSDGTFRTENEAAFTKWENLEAAGWKATLKDGTVLKYGQTAQARLDRPIADGGGTYKWMLQSAQDTNGNQVAYRYVTDAGQIYLSEIEYGLHATQPSKTLRLELIYTDGRPDAFVDYRGRFLSQTRKRLSSVTLWQDTRRLRLWKLDYWPGYHLSLLKSVTVYGDERSNTGDGAAVNVDFLPSLHLDYARQRFGEDRRMVTVGPAIDVSLAKGEADLVDLNRDGLPDVLFSVAEDTGEPAQYFSMLNRGPGQDFAAVVPFTSPAYLPDLRKPGVRIADWRGDGRAKILIPEDDGGLVVYYRDFTSPTTVGPDVDFSVLGFGLTDAQVQTVDVNNDRATDLVVPSGNRFEMLLSSPSGGSTQFVTGPVTPAGEVDFSQGWQFADMNGDRIADLVAIGTTNEGGTVYYPHRGMGEFDAAITMTGGPENGDLGTRETGSGGHPSLSLVDLDLDGLSDLVMVDSGIVRIWPNRSGTSWGSPLVFADATIPDWHEPNGQNAGTGVRFIDMNGNGSVDIVWNDPEAGYFIKYLELHPHTKPNQLTSMSNGIGKTLEIEYASSVTAMLADEAAGRTWTSKPPFPLPVVSAFTEHDGMGSIYRTQLTYRNGYYDAMEREFRGFETAVRTDVGNASQGAPSLVTEYLFYTGADIEALKGKPRRVERRESGGAIFDRVSSTWQTRQLPWIMATGEPRHVTFCFQQDETSNILEKGNGTPVELLKEMEWDNHGNQTKLAEFGRVEGTNRSAWDDERVLTRTFTSSFASGLQNWILSQPVTEELADEAGAIKARTEYYYDDETFSGGNPGVVTKGNLTLVRKAVDVAAGSYINAERLKYNAFGNVTDSYDPLYGAEPGHFRTFSYDPDFHSYVESETIDLGDTGAVSSLTASAAYDKGLGVITSSVDFNDNVSTYTHDTFARLSSIVRPGDTLAAPTESYEYRLGMDVGEGRTLNWINSFKRESAGGGTIDARVFFDGLGRKVMSRGEGETSAQTVVTDTMVFNDRRGSWKKYLPYFDTGGLDWKKPSFQSAFIDSTYDATGRVIAALNPPETIGGVRKSTRSEYQPLKTVLYDEEDNDPASIHTGTPHVQYNDGLGRLVGVDEMKGSEIFPTRYRYDVLDNLTSITDAQGNVKSMAYDGLKRMTGMDDPDRGVMTYIFDAASNLTESVDAKGQHILMTYDGSNRVKTEDYLAAAGSTPDVSYFYDIGDPVSAGDGTTVTATHALGKLVKIKDLSGEEHLSYDSRGRNAWKIKCIPNPTNGIMASYQSIYGYDSFNRPTQLTYPDGDHVEYGYNTRGLLSNITGGPAGFIISDTTYIATSQFESCLYGNGISSSYQYDPRQRLRSITTVDSTLTTPLVSLSYSFDGASNITRIDDNRAVGTLSASDPRRNTQAFIYDDLYRLIQVQYPGRSGQIDYDYDSIGNMVSQTSNIAEDVNGLSVNNLGTMSYGGTAGPNNRLGRSAGQPGPHALTAVSESSRSYSYDANGNMESIDGLTCTWDFKDRLIAVEDATMRADYTYDYTDRRITKKVTPKTTAATSSQQSTVIYVDHTFEIREDGAPVKYVWNGENRVARVTTNLNATQRLQRFALQPGWNFCTLAVALTNAGTQLDTAPVQSAFRYDPVTQTYHSIGSDQSLSAGTLLRIRASTAGELALQGTPPAPASVSYVAGRHWIGNATFQPIDLATALPATANFWFFDSTAQSWQVSLPGTLGSASGPPARLEPGEGIFSFHTAAFTLGPADPTLEVRYYHQDHLGSSSTVSDSSGQLVSESAFYPFGHPRNAYEPRSVKEAYGFSQKERDDESGLAYFEARFLMSNLSRFIVCDPLGAGDALMARIQDPQRFNCYSYAVNRPLVFVDPTGETEEQVANIRDAAFLAQAVYKDSSVGQTVVNSSTNTTWTTREVFDNPSGLTAVLYESSSGQHQLAFRGTEFFGDDNDLIDGLQNLVGIVPPQYHEAAAITSSLSEKYQNLQVTGHSLGGGLASYAAFKAGVGGWGFNSAPLGIGAYVSAMVSWITGSKDPQFTHVNDFRDPLSRYHPGIRPGEVKYFSKNQGKASGGDAHGSGTIRKQVDAYGEPPD